MKQDFKIIIKTVLLNKNIEIMVHFCHNVRDKTLLFFYKIV
jgi:hypothetical protein